MPNKKTNRRKRGGRPRSSTDSGFTRFEDVIISSVSPGNTLAYTRGSFEFPNDRSFYIERIQVSASPSTLSGPGIIQIRVLGAIEREANDFVWTSGPVLVPYGGLRRNFNIPRAEIVWPRNTANSQTIFAIDSICVASREESSLHMIVRVMLRLSREQAQAACPKTGHHVLIDPRTSLPVAPQLLDVDNTRANSMSRECSLSRVQTPEVILMEGQPAGYHSNSGLVGPSLPFHTSADNTTPSCVSHSSSYAELDTQRCDEEETD